MINLYVDKSINKIKLETDDVKIKYLLEVTKEETQFIPWKRKWGTVTQTKKIYDNKRARPDKYGNWSFTIGLGWAAYLCNVLRSYISQEMYESFIKDAILSENYRDIPFPELRDYQNEDVLHILKYKIGLFNVYTSYGKTQTISVLANYFHSIGKRVMIIAPGTKARDELVKRCKKLFNLDIPNSDLSINCLITTGLLNRKDIKDPVSLAQFETLMATYDVVLVDEVEYTINPSGEFLFERLKGASCFYGFSGTADKSNGNMITFINGLSDVVINNMDLIKWFGPSLVYRMPLTMDIDKIEIKTSALEHIKFDPTEFGDDQNVYMNVMNKIWTNPDICQLIKKIVRKYPKTFIPINNLTNILNEWINNYFIGEFRVLLVCGDGYIYYDLAGNKTKLTLQEACDKISAGEVDVIPSTSSGYRALDFPNLENILLIQGKVAGVVLQAVGRVARGTHMNVITLNTKSNKKIPVFTKGTEDRNDMIHEYYKYCNIVDSVLYEDNL